MESSASGLVNVFSLPHPLFLSSSSFLVFCLASALLLQPPAIADEATAAADITTTLFDLESSLRKTLQVSQAAEGRGSYFEIDEDRGDTNHKQSFRGYSVPLKPRSAVFAAPYPDYRSLTIGRLKRDSARVKWIQDRLDLAAGWTRTTEDAIPEEESPSSSSSEVKSGAGSGSNEYLVLIGIGTSKFHLALDTASELTWLQCDPCQNCHAQTDPIFVPNTSTTYSPLNCDPNQCKSSNYFSAQCGPDDTCRYRTGYGDGSSSEGDLAMEYVTFGDRSPPLRNITIGCGRNNTGMLVGSPAGILGLNGGPLSFPTQINASSFSYCLVDKDDTEGSSTLDFFVDPPVGAVVAPLKVVGGFYQIGLDGITVGGRNHTGVTGDVIVDSGTVVSRLQPDVYNSVRDAFVGQLNLTPGGQFGPMDTCFALSGINTTKVLVPTVSFHFSNGHELQLPAKNYLTQVDSSGTFCLAFAPASTPTSIIGNVQQQGIRVTYDLQASLFRFTPSNC